jgi:Putative beta barrel porin-7 (BBP7)
MNLTGVTTFRISQGRVLADKSCMMWSGRRLAIGCFVLLAGLAPAWGQSAPQAEEPKATVEPISPQSITAPSKFRLFQDKSATVAPSAEDAEFIEPRRPRFWLRSEYMIWWIKSANFPPLVTSGDTSDPLPGALNSLNTTILFGNPGMDFFDRKGGRFSAGWWLDDEQVRGVEASYFFVGGRSINRRIESPGNPPLANPFFNVNTGMADASLVTYPGIMSGAVSVEAPSFLQGADINFTTAVWQNEHIRLEALAGFRWVNLSEDLRIANTSLVQLAPQYAGLVPFDGNTISDNFELHNHFYGGQLGARFEFEHKRWTISLLGKVALGVSHQSANIHGYTNIDTTPAIAQDGGLYAVSSNSGRFTQNAFAVVPEAGINLQFRLTDNIRLFAGYTFLYWSNVARPGDQVDTNVNLNFVPTSTTFGTAGGPNRPAFSFRTTDFFAHGVNMGLELRY